MRKIGVLHVLALLALTACLNRPDALPTAKPVVPSDTPASAATSTPAQAVTDAPAPATDTAAPESTPTETSAPTATPSATPTVVAETPTPAATATPDPDQGVGEVAYQDPLDGTSAWFWGFSDDVATFGIADGRLRAVMSQANSGWRFSISPDTLRIGNQQVRVTARTVACGENDEYGIMFRGRVDAEGNYTAYLFKVRCGGAARFELVAGTGLMTITDWTPAPALQTGAPAENTLMVWAAGSQFRFYANGQYLFSAEDSTLADGFYGLYVYDRTAGGMTVDFNDLVARSVTP